MKLVIKIFLYYTAMRLFFVANVLFDHIIDSFFPGGVDANAAILMRGMIPVVPLFVAMAAVRGFRGATFLADLRKYCATSVAHIAHSGWAHIWLRHLSVSQSYWLNWPHSIFLSLPGTQPPVYTLEIGWSIKAGAERPGTASLNSKRRKGLSRAL